MAYFKLPARPLPYWYKQWKEDPICKAPGCNQEVERFTEACLVHNQLWHRMCADGANYYPDGERIIVRSIRRNRLKEIRQATVISRRRARMWEENEHICYLCGFPIADIHDSNLDHVIPRSRGGKGLDNNMRLTHQWCNTRKGNSLP